MGSTGSFTTVEENTGSAATGYTDPTVEADTGYEYRVIAVNGDGPSPESDSLTVLTLPGLIAVVARRFGIPNHRRKS